MTEPQEHLSTLRVRYGETDKMGVVYHGNYLTYFEIGRTEFLRDVGLAYSELEETGYRLVVTEAGCRYRSAARYDDVLSIRTKITLLTRVTVRFEYRILRAELLVAEGHTLLACLDKAGRPSRLPGEISDSLKDWGGGNRP